MEGNAKALPGLSPSRDCEKPALQVAALAFTPGPALPQFSAAKHTGMMVVTTTASRQVINVMDQRITFVLNQMQAKTPEKRMKGAGG